MVVLVPCQPYNSCTGALPAMQWLYWCHTSHVMVVLVQCHPCDGCKGGVRDGAWPGKGGDKRSALTGKGQVRAPGH